MIEAMDHGYWRGRNGWRHLLRVCGAGIVAASVFLGVATLPAMAAEDGGQRGLHGTLSDADPAMRPFGIGLGTCYRERLNGLLGHGEPPVIQTASEDQAPRTPGTHAAMNGLIGRATMSDPLPSDALVAMDSIDRACVIMALEFSADNEPIRWANPHNVVDYRITPVKSFSNSRGERCRVLSVEATQSGEARTSFASICRGVGAWSAMADG